MIDFHCHLDLYPEPAQVVAEATRAGTYVLAVTTTPRAFPTLKKMTRNSNRVRVALGLHPELAAERHLEVDLFPLLLRETDYVGEIGLDGSASHKSSLAIQEKVLKKILRHCEAGHGRILSIHSRGAASRVMDCLEEAPRAGTPIFHWFTGTASELDRAIGMGAWFSLGPAMLRSMKAQDLAAVMPRDRVLTETDGPFGRNGSEPLYPWDATKAEDRLAALWGCEVDEVREQLRANLASIGEQRQRRLLATQRV